jgi:hypothetical protein
MAVDLTDQIPLETGPKMPVTNPVPKLDDIEVEVGDLSPLAAERAADGTRSKLTAAPPPIPMRARRASTMPPPIPSRSARGSAAPRSRVSLVEPKATPEMMASWQINPEAPLSETAPAVEPVRPSAPPPLPFAVKAPVDALPTTIELVRAPEAVKPEIVKQAETPLLTGNAPSVVTASATALPVVQQEIIPSPRESRVTQLPTSQPGADVADLPVWPMAPVAKTMGEVLAARASSTSLPPPTRDSSRLPAPRGRNTLPPPIPTVAAEPAPVAPKVPTLAAPPVLVAPEVVAKNVSALDGSDGWVFEDDYDERQVDGEVVPTTYFERTEPPPQTRSRFLIAAGGAAAALAVIVGIAMHGSSSTTATAKAIAKPAETTPAPINSAALAKPEVIAETPPPPPAPVAAVMPAPVPAPTVVPTAAPSATAAQLTTLPITSWPDGATVTLVDNGNATVLGRTPVSAALDRSHSYDVVLAVVGRPTIVKHVDFATMHELAVDLDPVPKDVVAAHAPAPKPHHTAPTSQIAVPNFDAPPAPVTHHHHHDVVAQTPAPAPTPAPAKAKEVALAAPDGAGFLMVSAKPPCEIVIDGKPTKLTTPQRSISLAPGAHAVTLINASIGIRKTIAVKVEAKKPTKLIQDFTKS